MVKGKGGCGGKSAQIGKLGKNWIGIRVEKLPTKGMNVVMVVNT